MVDSFRRADYGYRRTIMTPRSRIFCSAAPKKMPTPAPVVKNASVKKMIFDPQTERETSSAATSA
jgi:hypothetical protein